MEAIINTLQATLNQTNLHFTDKQVTWLLNHVGALYPAIRDDLVYQLLGRGLESQAFTDSQKQQIIQPILKEHWLFKSIEEPTNDRVFLRSFTALLTTEILLSDTTHPWLTDTTRNQLFDDALTYLVREHDQRGFVRNKGWAHAIAHGSDLLGVAWCHPQFPISQSSRALSAIQTVVQRQNRVFFADEEARLAHPLIMALTAHKLTDNELCIWLQTTNQLLIKELNSTDLTSIYREHNWLRLIHHLYFWLPAKNIGRLIIEQISHQYYDKNGYLDFNS